MLGGGGSLGGKDDDDNGGGSWVVGVMQDPALFKYIGAEYTKPYYCSSNQCISV